MRLARISHSRKLSRKPPAGKTRGRGRGGFTLAEMIMAVAMLAFFSVFIVQMFVKADQISRQTACLDQAVLTASDWADEWKRSSSQSMSPEIAQLMAIKEDGTKIESYLNHDFQPCTPDNASYTAVLSLSRPESDGQDATDHLWTLSIIIYQELEADQTPLYALDVTRYFPEGG